MSGGDGGSDGYGDGGVSGDRGSDGVIARVGVGGGIGRGKENTGMEK